MCPAEDVPASGPPSASVAGHVSPAVEALRAFISASVHTLEQDDAQHPARGEGLLYFGAWSDALPRMLIEDPVLAPTDKVVWQIIKLRASAQSPTAFPSYQTIGRLANVRAQATVARAIAILRASRWLTLCARVRDPRGRFRGNVYTLHDEPLPLADTLYLDPQYMHFLEAALEHQHGRVRNVAAAALATIEDAVRRGLDVTHQQNPIERRVEALGTVHAHGQGGFYSFNRHRLEQLRRGNGHAPPPPLPTSESEDRRQHDANSCLHAPGTARVAPENSAAGALLRSSSSIETTTTTDVGPRSKTDFCTPALHFPQRLSANHEAIALMYLEHLPPNRRQSVLDELEGRLRAERHGAPAVYDPLRFLKKLCDAVASGDFVENLGVAVRAEREHARRSEARLRTLDAVVPVELPPPDPNSALVQRVQRLRATQAARTQKP